MAEITKVEVQRRVKRREVLKEMDLSGLHFAEMNLDGGDFRKCKLEGSTFNGIPMSYTRFEACNLSH